MEINITLLSGDTDADPQEFQVEVTGDDNTKTTHKITAGNCATRSHNRAFQG